MEHAKKLLNGFAVDLHDIVLLAFMLLENNTGIRPERIWKMNIDLVKCTKHKVELEIIERTKNSTNFSCIVLRHFPGTRLSNCILMYSMLSLSSWLLKLGNTNGLLFVILSIASLYSSFVTNHGLESLSCL